MLQPKDTVKVTIEGSEYEIPLLSVSRAFVTGQELIKLFLPSAGAAVDGIYGDNLLEDQQTFASMAVHMVHQLDAIDTLGIVDELLKEMKCDGFPCNYDTHFRGNLGDFIQVLEFVLKENYSSLFTGTSLSKKLMTFMRDFQAQAQTQEEAEVANEQDK